MPVFVVLGKLTRFAIKNIGEAAERDKKAEQVIKAAGGKILANYYTLGRYDFVVIVDLPSHEALVKALIEIGTWGSVSTETMTTMLPEQFYQATKGL